MRLRRRLLVSMIGLVALGLAAMNVITLTSLHRYLYGRVDTQLTAASRQMIAFMARAERRGFTVSPTTIGTHVGPDLYVEILDPAGHASVTRPSDSSAPTDPAPQLPSDLRALSERPSDGHTLAGHPYRPNSTAVTVPAAGGRGPAYRLLATSLPGRILIVATPLTTVDATLSSLRTIELAVSVALLVTLLVLMTLLIRQGLRPLEGMARDADAIAAGDLGRRVRPTEGDGEIARLGRALNGMLDQIETAFAQRALSEERLRGFLADASHELRTPLTSIRGYAELLRKDALGERGARNQALARIEQEAARMGALVGDMSVLASGGEGPELVRRRVDLSAVAAEAVADARARDAERPIVLHAPTVVSVVADDARLRQMVHNLVGNALAHTPPGTPVDVTVGQHHDRAVLEVRDRGPGMSEEQAARVFDRFYRGTASRNEEGSGLGLFIVATLARAFGGEASVETAPGRGATFRVVLPALDPGSERPDAIVPGRAEAPRGDEGGVGEVRPVAAPAVATRVTTVGGSGHGDGDGGSDQGTPARR